jgi:AraC-like DNA-binding protein
MQGPYNRSAAPRSSAPDNHWFSADNFGYDSTMSLDGALRVIVSELASVGLDPARVCAEAQIDPRQPHDGGVALGLDGLTRVLERAEAISGDALLGLHMAERAHGRGVLAYLARTQGTVGEALAAFAEFGGRSWGREGAVQVARHGPRAFVAFRLGEALPRHALEYVVARTAIALCRSGAGASEVWFRHAPAAVASDYVRVLRSPVRFRQAETGVALRADLLDRPLRTANPEAAGALVAALGHAPARAASTTSARVVAAVERALARGDRIDREALARSLGMSGKTLARRLAVEERQFHDVVDQVRRTVARRLVVEEPLALGEVAARVGFADLASFGKAFRRWFGGAPSTFRARRRIG